MSGFSPVGHLVNTPSGLQGEPGLGYNYILASDGLYLRAESALLKATIQIAGCQVRGLAALSPHVELVHGKLPRHIWDLALSLMLLDPGRELYVAIVWTGDAYSLRVPEQTVTGAAVRYEPVKDTVVELHSHGGMSAFFSSTDDADEVGFRVYAVVGKLPEEKVEVSFRVGVYGYFGPLMWEDVFQGVLDGGP
jgi:PRTRC genetic system protein A